MVNLFTEVYLLLCTNRTHTPACNNNEHTNLLTWLCAIVGTMYVGASAYFVHAAVYGI